LIVRSQALSPGLQEPSRPPHDPRSSARG
jgi:hypothetical protein